MVHNWHIFHFIPQKIANKFVNGSIPPNGFRFHILSNVTPKILAIFGDFIRRYEDKSLNLRW